MNKIKKISSEGILYDNRVLVVISIVVAIALWAVVKINYSADTTRTFSDIKIKMNTSFSQAGEYEAFLEDAEFTAEVEVAGKAYNLSQYALTKDDIIVEASSAYIDSPGYKVLTLSARVMDSDAAGGVEIVKIEPSTITIFYDRRTTGTFNVEVRCDRNLSTIAGEDLIVDKLIPSVSTVQVTGPSTVLNRVKKVYFDVKLNDSDLPLTSTSEFVAEISYQLDRESDKKYLHCEGITEANPAKVTIPIYATKEVTPFVGFVNQPEAYADVDPQYTVEPGTVTVTYNTDNTEISDTVKLGSIDFSVVSNKKNVFEFIVPDDISGNMVDKTINKFTVTLDMSSMGSKKITTMPGKVVFTGQDSGMSYAIDSSQPFEITVIGPKSVLKNLTAEDLQLVVNVSSVDNSRASVQSVDVSSIKIKTEGFEECWVYGNYTVKINTEKKTESNT